jgi:hypothetical protein
MRCLFKSAIVTALLLNVACVSHFQEKVIKILPLQNHSKEYRTKARSIPKMPPSAQFHYDDRYAVPAIEKGASLDSDSLIIPPGSKR